MRTLVFCHLSILDRHLGASSCTRTDIERALFLSSLVHCSSMCGWIGDGLITNGERQLLRSYALTRVLCPICPFVPSFRCPISPLCHSHHVQMQSRTCLPSHVIELSSNDETQFLYYRRKLNFRMHYLLFTIIRHQRLIRAFLKSPKSVPRPEI